MNKEEKLLLINEIFTPSSPIENKDLFSGREAQLEEIRQAIFEKGQHLVMFGPRGAGKTSLANMTSFFFDDLMTIKVSCNRNDNFRTIWHKALSKIHFAKLTKQIGFKPADNNEIIPLPVPEVEFIDSMQVEQILTSMDEYMLFIFDEFDSIKSQDTKSQMADMVKLLSDNLPNISILIVGIAQSVNKLLGEHPSVERCVKQIELPLMNEKESKTLIEYNLRQLGLKIKKTIINKVADLSCGFPNYIHLLCKYAAYQAIIENKPNIIDSHFNQAVHKSINNSDFSIRNAYLKATSSGKKKNQFSDVLLACALANTDNNNSFDSIEVLNQFNRITDYQHKVKSINYNLGMLCKPERAEILTRTGRQKKARYQFRKPLLKAFVKMKQHELSLD